MSRIKTFAEYKAWWANEVSLARRTMPEPGSMVRRYTTYLDRAPAYLADEVNHARQEFELLRQVNKKAAHTAMYGNGAAPSWGQDQSLVHRDGNPYNNDLGNLMWVSHEQLVNQKQTVNHKIGYTIEEAIKMNACVVKVIYSADYIEGVSKTYEFLAPKDTKLNEDVAKHTYAVVPSSRILGVISTSQQFDIVQVVGVVDLVNAEYDGKLKHVISIFNADEHNERFSRQKKREALIKKATALAEEKNSIEKLTKLIGDSEEGKALLAAIAELE